MEEEKANMPNVLVSINLRRKVFSLDKVKMLFNVFLGKVIKKKLCWVAEVLFEAVVEPCIGEGVNAGLKTKELTVGLKITGVVCKRISSHWLASVRIDGCKVEIKRRWDVVPKGVGLVVVVVNKCRARKLRAC